MRASAAPLRPAPSAGIGSPDRSVSPLTGLSVGAHRPGICGAPDSPLSDRTTRWIEALA